LGPDRIRVVVPDVGGAFGMKGMFFPEYVLVAAAASGHRRAIVKAAIDALRHHGVSDLQMPLRPRRVWEAIRPASAGGN
jgi:CO/xanthine dehydrogenase Mo-binding subunit